MKTPVSFISFWLPKEDEIITELCSSQGDSSTSFREIEKEVLSFFSRLYQQIPGVHAIPFNFCLSMVSATQNLETSTPFLDMEMCYQGSWEK